MQKRWLGIIIVLGGCRLFSPADSEQENDVGPDVRDVRQDVPTADVPPAIDTRLDARTEDMMVDIVEDADAGPTIPEDWADTTQPHRMRYSFNRAVFGDQFNGAVVADVFIDPNNFPDGVDTDLGAIRFFDSMNQELAFDLEITNDPKKHYFVPLRSSDQAEISMFAYWGGPTDSVPSPLMVWRDYTFVLHGDEALPSDRAGNILGLTSLNTQQASVDGRAVYEITDGGITTDDVADFFLRPGTEFHAQVRFRALADTGLIQTLLHIRRDCVGMDINAFENNGVRVFHGTTCAGSAFSTEVINIPPAAGVWRDLTVSLTLDQAGTTLGTRIYLDGALALEDMRSGIDNTIPVDAAFTIGSNRLISEFFTGSIDEVRVLRTNLNRGRVAAEYASSIENLFTVDPIETIVPTM